MWAFKHSGPTFLATPKSNEQGHNFVSDGGDNFVVGAVISPPLLSSPLPSDVLFPFPFNLLFSLFNGGLGV